MQWDHENIILHAVKPTENNNKIVFRLSEEMGKRTTTIIGFDNSPKRVVITNLLEQEEQSCTLDKYNRIEVHFKPFEIVTIVAEF